MVPHNTGPSLESKKIPFLSMFFDLVSKSTWASILVHLGLHFGCFFDDFLEVKTGSKKCCRNSTIFTKRMKLPLDRPCEFSGICNEI